MGIRKKKNLLDKAHDVADQVLPQVETAVGTAVGQAVNVAKDGREKAGPMLAHGKELAAGAATVAAAKAVEAAHAAQDTVEEITADTRKQQKKGGKFKKFLFVSVAAAIGGVVFKKLKEGREADKWQSTYTPPPAPTPPAPRPASPTPAPASPSVTSVDADTDDAAGADPSEALSDAHDAPHAPTTPDAPAEEVDVNDPDAKNN